MADPRCRRARPARAADRQPGRGHGRARHRGPRDPRRAGRLRSGRRGGAGARGAAAAGRTRGPRGAAAAAGLRRAAAGRASIARALEIAGSLRGRLAGGGAGRPDLAGDRPGEVITVFSAKGGCGKTFLATNLAVALAARGAGVALVDLDLHFGDVAIMLQLFPTHTIQDAARELELDAAALRSYLTPHAAGVWTLAAPTEPAIADTVSASAVAAVLRLLRSSFAYVVVDTPVAFYQSDATALLATLDVPSIKNLKLTMQTMERLRYTRSRVRVVVNRADSRVGLRLPDVESILGAAVDVAIPSSRSVPISVNKGNPVILEEPRGNVAEAIRRVAAQLAPTVAGAPAPLRSRRSLFQRS